MYNIHVWPDQAYTYVYIGVHERNFFWLGRPAIFGDFGAEWNPQRDACHDLASPITSNYERVTQDVVERF